MYRAKHAKQRQHITAVILCFTMLFSIISGVLPLQYASAEEFYTATETVESFSGYSVHDGFVEITQYDKVEVYADSADAYQWQILINNAIWVNIQDQNEPSIQLSYALVSSALDVNDMAFIRCAYGDGLYSDELAVQTYYIVESEMETVAYTLYDSRDASMDDEYAIAVASEEGASTSTPSVYSDTTSKSSYDIIVRYMLDGKLIAPAWTATVAASTTETVYSEYFPEIQGYEPMVSEELLPANVTFVKKSTTGQAMDFRLAFTPPTELNDIVVTVHYRPANVEYTIKYFLQQGNTNKYSEVFREHHHGKTGEKVLSHEEKQNEIENKYSGFTMLEYDKELLIAADGSTIVEVYYDRNYYLMTFELGEGGYGVEPIYTYYEGSIGNIGTPVRAGYEFLHWHLVGANDVEGDVGESIPTTMPAQNTTYRAHWRANDTVPVTVVVWGEDVNTNTTQTTYSYQKSVTIYTIPSTTITFQYICGLEEHTHSGDDTLTCKLEEHYHDDACYKNCNVHTHTVNCYNGVGAVDTSFSYNGTAQNGLIQGNWDGRNYTRVIYINNVWYKYTGSTWSGNVASTICGKSVSDHTHDETCNLNCSKTPHKHGGTCWSCGKVLHTHTAACKLDIDLLDTALWTYKTSDSVFVQPDGSSVLNVYFERKEFTINFYTSSSVNANNLIYTIKEKWGTNISKYWPIPKKNGNGEKYDDGERWDPKNSNTYDDVLVHIETMPAESFTLHLSESKNDTKKMTYYLESLTETNNTYTFNNVTKSFNIEPYKVINANYNYITEAEDFFPIDGFTQWTSNPKFSGGQIKGNAAFYYSRNSYTLELRDGYDGKQEISIPYEAKLSDYYEQIRTPDLPSAYPPGSHVFAGWYKDPKCTSGQEYTFTTETMPADNLIAYAKWTKVSNLVVRFYDAKTSVSDASKTPIVTASDIVYDSLLTTTPSATQIKELEDSKKMKFVGWFYMDGDTEKAFDFANMTVKKNMDVYAKWSSNVSLPYVVYYKLVDEDGDIVQENGNEVHVAPATSGSALVGATRTFDAKTGTDLYEGYQEFYFPTVVSHSIDIGPEENGHTNEFTFTYKEKAAVPYTVRYVCVQNGVEKQLATPTVYKFNKKSIVTEQFKPIAGHMPDAYQKQLIVRADAHHENVITFYYTEDVEHAYYKVTHYFKALDNTWDVYQTMDYKGTIGTTYSAMNLSLSGNLSGYHFANATITTTGDPIAYDPGSGIKLTSDGMHIEFYYERNLYPYEIRYVLQNYPSELLHPTATGSALYGALLSSHAIVIDGYEVVSGDHQKHMHIGIPTEETPNVMIFNYIEKNVRITYAVAEGVGGTLSLEKPSNNVLDGARTGLVVTEQMLIFHGEAGGATPSTTPGYKFVGWYTDAACIHPVNSNWVTTDGAFTLVPSQANGRNVEATYYAKFEQLPTTLVIQTTGSAIAASDMFIFTVSCEGEQPFEVTVRGEEGRAKISGLKVGKTYKVQEQTAWSWRYLLSGTTSQSITLTSITTNNQEPNVVTFTNNRTIDQWLSHEYDVENIFRKLLPSS